MDTNSKYLMVGGAGLAVVVAAMISILLARQPATTVAVPSPAAGAAGGAVVQSVSAAPETAPVLVARVGIPSGTLIHARDTARLFRLIAEPRGAVVLPAVFSDYGTLNALLDVVPRQTTAIIVPGEQLSASLLSGLALPVRGSAAGALVPRGYDAESVVITINRAVNGVIGVNDRVDVLYSVPVKAGVSVPGTEPAHTAMLIQGAVVVSSQPLSNTYTLAVRPQEALRLAHVQDAGWNIHLALRSVFDTDTVRPTHRTMPDGL